CGDSGCAGGTSSPFCGSGNGLWQPWRTLDIDRYNITQSLRGDNNGESQRIDPASYPEDWDVLLTDVFHKSWPLASDPLNKCD
ncbi:phage terminase large subunit domain protein, partial [Escherichia coli 2864350]